MESSFTFSFSPQDGDAELCNHHFWFDCPVFIYAGMKTLLKKYELPKQEEVNAYKHKLERIHAEFATSSK